MRHEADGVYYLDAPMIDKLHPCQAWRSYMEERCKDAPDGRVIITLYALVAAIEKTRFEAHLILSSRLRDHQKITCEDERAYDTQHFESTGRTEGARVTMNMLANMARQQGLLP